MYAENNKILQTALKQDLNILVFLDGKALSCKQHLVQPQFQYWWRFSGFF